MNYGHLQVNVKENNLGVIESRSFQWVGGKRTTIPYHAFREDYIVRSGNVVFIGPYRCIIIDENYWGYELIRMDNAFTWLIVFWYRLSKVMQLVYSRLILTCAIWNLAEYHANTIPSYLDLHIVKFFKKIIR